MANNIGGISGGSASSIPKAQGTLSQKIKVNRSVTLFVQTMVTNTLLSTSVDISVEQGNATMIGHQNPGNRSNMLKRLLRDQAGNTLALVAASVIPIIGIVGGAVDMGRGYMAKARLQQACDAGALAARGVMDTGTLTQENKDHGLKYFDFNFPAGSYGTTNLVRSYTQPQSNTGVLQPLVNGSATAKIPTSLMRVFGQTEIDLAVTCTSKKDVSHADVSMVLDVTGSMDSNMDKDASGTIQETRISALRRSVKAFYDALGPGRAAGDTTKGRIRYAFVPYGVVANVGWLLNQNQMVNSHTYSSRQPIQTTMYSWTQGGTHTKQAYPAWPTPNPPPASVVAASQVPNNFGSFSPPSGSGAFSYTRLDGTTNSLPRTITRTSANCYQANTTPTGSNNNNPGLVDAMHAPVVTETSALFTSAAPVHPQTVRDVRNWTETETNNVRALRYRWVSNTCRLELSGNGNSNARWVRTRTTTSTAPITWTTHAPNSGFVYNERTIDVSPLKHSSGTGWNSTLTVPNINISGGTWYDVKLSGRDKKISGNSTVDDWTEISVGGSATSGTTTWRGCVEERSTDTSISGSTPLAPIPAFAYDLDVTDPVITSNDATRWRPWLSGISFTPTGGSSGDECPSPAIKLQEFSSYTASVLTSNYPMLFDSASGGLTSYYYPHTTTTWSDGSSQNAPSLRNYIDRIQRVDGTIHDSGFIWGLHLLSGQGMFASENPDFFEGTIVNRNLVFMTDGDLNPGPDRYVYSGLNNIDGRLAPKDTTWSNMRPVHNRRLRILCEAAKAQGITVWVVIIKDGVSTDTDLRACASSAAHFKSADTADELVNSFTVIAQSIGGLRLTR
jgi:Flp pilus assembly protein TadG